MCYNFKTSIISYVLGLLAVIFAFTSKQYIIGCFILCYIQIQLSEMLIWRGIETNNMSLNKIGTSFGKYMLPTHNIALAIGIIISLYLSHTLKLKDFIPLVVSIIFLLYVVCIFYKKNTPPITYPYEHNVNNRLEWTFPTVWYLLSFVISIVLVICYIKPKTSLLLFLSVYILSFLFLMFSTNKSMFGSLWCFSAAVLAPIIVLLNYFIIRNQPSQT